MALANRILKNGIVGGATGLGGNLVSVNSDTVRNGDLAAVHTVDRMVKGATFVDAVKLAKEMEPESSVIEAIETNGVPHCIRMKPDTPQEVLLWMRDSAHLRASAGSAD